MGMFGKLFGGSEERGGDSSVPDATETAPVQAVGLLACDTCMNEVPEEELEFGQCNDCASADYSGPKYCCGAIYEDGEDTCRSCGEPL